jgi:putative YhdH/YhfP family quinone oxidoreductase
MTSIPFKAWVVKEAAPGRFTRQIVPRRTTDLPPGDVLVRVAYSSINYKDLLSATGNRGVTRRYPHTPGIDAAGVVVESASGEFQPGDEVIVTSYDLGMNTDGGFGQFIRVPAGWGVPLPAGLTLRESMIYGTAGFTAALSIMALVENGLTPAAGEILVSGATGGVGGLAVSILAKIGFQVAAVNGHVDQGEYLRQLGASRIIDPAQARDDSGRPLLKAVWAGSVDSVGGELLATTLKSTAAYGVVACCGNAASADLPINVYPFILRGVRLIGIDSQNCPMAERRRAWARIAGDWKIAQAEAMVEEIGLADLDSAIEKMLARGHRGRTIVRLRD